MPHPESTTPATTKIASRPTRREVKPVDLFHCLIVSADLSRQEMLARAAVEGGWETVICGDSRTALAYSRAMFLQLAIVDLDGQSVEDFDDLLEVLGPAKLLLLVCGNEGDTEEEVRVRQLGAWLYLPGVVETSDVSLLCTEARHIAQRLHAMARGTERASNPSNRTLK
jgi:ActR/RegA family two-component response regulator